MTLAGNIKDKLLISRINKNQKNVDFYSFILGEIDNKATVLVGNSKVCKDEDVIKVLKSLEKSLNESIRLGMVNAQNELNLLLEFLPKQMSSDDIKNVLIASGACSMPGMMKYLKDNHAGGYDGKIASQIAKELTHV